MAMEQQTAGREYASVDLAERTVHEVYLPPFAAAIAAGAAAIMPAFIDIAGVPMSANASLATGLAAPAARFRGGRDQRLSNAITELRNQGVAQDDAEAAALALTAGIDVDMASEAYLRGLPAALARGLITMTAIDTSVRRVLRLKERLGLFDDPHRRGAAGQRSARVRQLAREVGRRAIVLLTHRGHVLPLSSGHTAYRSLIGPLASAEGEMLGPWASAGRSRASVSILKGLAAALPRCRIDCLSGVDVSGRDMRGIPAAIERCRAAEVVILCLGEDASMSGAGREPRGPRPARMLARTGGSSHSISASPWWCCSPQAAQPSKRWKPSSAPTPCSPPGFSARKPELPWLMF